MAVASEAAVRAAIDTQVQTLTGYGFSFEGVPYTPVVGTPYVAVQIVGLAEMAVAAGEKAAERWDGFLQVTVYRPQGEGTVPIATARDAVRELFKRGTSLTATDGTVVRFDTPSSIALMFDRQWVQGVVRCPFFFYSLPT